ncbi:hypothetical protein MCI89_08010 [Muricomes sp. OA1]|nr:hypothetical protein [Faecalicatena contorta]MCH1972290.1 hypothetical protein [Muricomes sp. OA1]
MSDRIHTRLNVPLSRMIKADLKSAAVSALVKSGLIRPLSGKVRRVQY